MNGLDSLGGWQRSRHSFDFVSIYKVSITLESRCFSPLGYWFQSNAVCFQLEVIIIYGANEGIGQLCLVHKDHVYTTLNEFLWIWHGAEIWDILALILFLPLPPYVILGKQFFHFLLLFPLPPAVSNYKLFRVRTVHHNVFVQESVQWHPDFSELLQLYIT